MVEVCGESLHSFAGRTLLPTGREASLEVPMASVLEDREQSKKENGTSLMFIGLALWVADALVVLFLPASVRLGSQRMFVTVILALAAVGLALMASGYLRGGKPEE